MLPDQPMQPGPKETAITFEAGLIVLAIGCVVALIIVAKLLWEYWRYHGGDSKADGEEDEVVSSDDPPDAPESGDG